MKKVTKAVIPAAGLGTRAVSYTHLGAGQPHDLPPGRRAYGPAGLFGV